MASNIEGVKVSIRSRPMIKRESGCESQWDVDTHQVRLKSNKQKSYVYDRVFSDDETTNDVYEEIAEPIIQSAMKGFNGTIFAYGQTSSGKTYTMMGSRSNPGIIPLAVNEIFSMIQKTPEREFLLRVSYLEIYNENLKDLLATEVVPLSIREDEFKTVIVHGLVEEMVTSPEDVMALMERGEKQRQMASTNMNERSSRSHTICRMIIESRERAELNRTQEEAEMAVKVSHLNLVDLAGSERASQTGAEGQRLKEGCYINKSLMILGQVINQICKESESGPGTVFKSFRDSKLTRILQSSLGGNSLTAIICTVTLAVVDETESTLRFASSAKQITNKPIVNEVLSDEALLIRQKREINKLKRKIEEMERQKGQLGVDDLLAEKELLQDKNLKLTRILLVSSLPPDYAKKQQKMRRETWCPGARGNNLQVGWHATPPKTNMINNETLLADFSVNQSTFISDLEVDERSRLFETPHIQASKRQNNSDSKPAGVGKKMRFNESSLKPKDSRDPLAEKLQQTEKALDDVKHSKEILEQERNELLEKVAELEVDLEDFKKGDYPTSSDDDKEELKVEINQLKGQIKLQESAISEYLSEQDLHEVEKSKLRLKIDKLSEQVVELERREIARSDTDGYVKGLKGHIDDLECQLRNACHEKRCLQEQYDDETDRTYNLSLSVEKLNDELGKVRSDADMKLVECKEKMLTLQTQLEASLSATKSPDYSAKFESEIAALKMELNIRNENIVDLQKTVDELNCDLKNSKEKYEDTIEELRKELLSVKNSPQDSVFGDEPQISFLDEKTKCLEEAIQHCEQLIAEKCALESQYNMLENQCSEKEKNIETLKQRTLSQQSKIDELLEQAEFDQNEKQILFEEEKIWTEKVHKLEEEIKKLGESTNTEKPQTEPDLQVDQLKKQIGNLERSSNDAQLLFQDTNHKLSKALSEITTLQECKEKLEKELELKQSDLDSYMSMLEISKPASHYAPMQRSFIDQPDVDEDNVQVQAKTPSKQALEENPVTEELKNKIRELEQLKEAHMTEILKMSAKHETRVKEITLELEEVKQELCQIRSEAASKDSPHSKEFVAKVDELTAQLQDSKSEVDHLKEKLLEIEERSSKDIEDHEKAKQALQNQSVDKIEEQKMRVQVLEEELEAEKKSCTYFQELDTTNKRQIEDLKDMQESQLEKINNLHIQLKQEHERFINLQDEMRGTCIPGGDDVSKEDGEMRDELTSCRKKILDLCAENKKLQELAEHRQDALLAESNKELGIEKQLHIADQLAKDSIESFANERNVANKEIEKLQKQLDDTQKMLVKATSEKDITQHQLEKQLQICNDLKQEINEKERDGRQSQSSFFMHGSGGDQKLEAKVKRLTQNLDLTKQTMWKLEQTNKELTDEKRSLEHDLHQLRVSQSESEKLQKGLTAAADQITCLQNDLEKQKLLYQDAGERAEKQKKELGALVEAKEIQICDMKASLEETKKNLQFIEEKIVASENMQSDDKKKLENSNQLLSNAQRDVQILQEEKNKCQEEICALKTKQEEDAAKIRSLDASDEEHLKVIQGLKSKVEELSAEITDFKIVLVEKEENMMKRNEEHVEIVQGLEMKIRELTSEVETTQKALVEKQEGRTEVIHEMETKCVDLASEVEALQTALKEKEEDLAKMQEDAASEFQVIQTGFHAKEEVLRQEFSEQLESLEKSRHEKELHSERAEENLMKKIEILQNSLNSKEIQLKKLEEDISEKAEKEMEAKRKQDFPEVKEELLVKAEFSEETETRTGMWQKDEQLQESDMMKKLQELQEDLLQKEAQLKMSDSTEKQNKELLQQKINSMAADFELLQNSSQTKVNEYRQQLHAAEEKLELCEKQVETLECELEELKISVNAKKEEQMKLLEGQEHLDETQQNFVRLYHEYTQLTEALNEVQIQNQELTKSLEEQQVKLIKGEECKNALVIDIEGLHQKVAENNELLEVYQHKLTEELKNNTLLKENLFSLQSENKDLCEELEKSKKEFSDLEALLAEIDVKKSICINNSDSEIADALKQKVEELERLQDSLLELEQKLSENEKTTEMMTLQITTLQSENKQLCDEIKELAKSKIQSETKDATSNNTGLINQHSELSPDYEKLKQELNDLELQNRGLQAQLESIVSSTDADFTNKIEEVKSENKTLSETAKELKVVLDDVQTKNKELEKLVLDQNDQLDSKSAKLQNAEKIISELELKFKDQQRILSTEDVKIEMNADENLTTQYMDLKSKYKTEVDELRCSIASKDSLTEELKTTISNLKEKISSDDDFIRSLQNKLSAVIAENRAGEELKTTILNLKEKISSNEVLIDALQKELMVANENAALVTEEAKVSVAQSEQYLSSLRAEVTELKSEIGNLTCEHTASVAALTERNSMLQEEIENTIGLKESLAQMQKEIDAKSRLVEELGGSLKSCEKQIEILESEQKKSEELLKTQSERSEKEIKYLNELLESEKKLLDEKVSELKNTTVLLKEATEKVEKNDTISVSNSGLDHKICETKILDLQDLLDVSALELRRSRGDQEQLTQLLKERENEMKELQKAKDDSDAQQKDVASVKDLLVKKEAELTDFMLERDQLEENVKSLKSEIDLLNNQLKFEKDEKSDLQVQVEDLKRCVSEDKTPLIEALNAQRDLSEAEKNFLVLYQEFTTLTEKCSTLESAAISSKDNAEKLTLTIKEQEIQINELKHDLEVIKQQKTDLEIAKTCHESERLDLEKLKTTIEALTESCDSTKSDLKIETAKVARLEEECKIKEEAVMVIEEKLQSKSAELVMLSEKLHSSVAENEQKEERLCVMQSKLDKLNQDNTEFASIKLVMEKDMARLKEQHSFALKQTEEVNLKLCKELEEMKTKVSRTAHVEELQNELQSLKEKMESDLHGADNEKKRLVDIIQELKAAINEKEAKIQQFDERLELQRNDFLSEIDEANRASKKETNRYIEMVKLEEEKLQVQLKQKNEEFSKCQQNLEAKTCECLSLQEKITEIEGTLRNQDALLQKTQDCDLMKQKTDESEQKFKDLQGKYSKLHMDYLQVCKEVEQFEAETEELKQKVDASADNENLVKKAQAFDQLQTEFKELDQKMENLQRKYSKRHLDYLEVCKEVDNLEAENEKLKTKGKRTGTRSSESELNKDLENALAEIKVLQKKYNKWRTDYMQVCNEVDQLEAENDGLKNAQKQIEKELKKVQLEVKTLNELMPLLPASQIRLINQREVEIETEQAKLQEFKENLEKQSANINENEKLKTTLQSRDVDVKVLKSKIQQLEKSLIQYKTMQSKQRKENEKLLEESKLNQQPSTATGGQSSRRVTRSTVLPGGIVQRTKLDIQEKEMSILRNKMEYMEKELAKYKAIEVTRRGENQTLLDENKSLRSYMTKLQQKRQTRGSQNTAIPNQDVAIQTGNNSPTDQTDESPAQCKNQ